MYSLAQSQYVIKIDIETQKKHIRLNVSAKAFISMTFQNPTEHTYRFRISKILMKFLKFELCMLRRILESHTDEGFGRNV